MCSINTSTTCSGLKSLMLQRWQPRQQWALHVPEGRAGQSERVSWGACEVPASPVQCFAAVPGASLLLQPREPQSSSHAHAEREGPTLRLYAGRFGGECKSFWPSHRLHIHGLISSGAELKPEEVRELSSLLYQHPMCVHARCCVLAMLFSFA